MPNKKTENGGMGLVTKCYSLTPATIRAIADYAKKNECTQSTAIRALIRMGLEKANDDR